MKYSIIAGIMLVLATLPSCSLRKEKKKQSIHKKRKASQRAAYASTPGDAYIPPTDTIK